MPDLTVYEAPRDSVDIPGLLSAMKTESPRLRNAAKAHLLQKGPDEVVAHLEAAIRDNSDADRRNSAIEVFVGFGTIPCRSCPGWSWTRTGKSGISPASCWATSATRFRSRYFCPP